MTTINTDMKVRAIAPWFGGKRTLAPRIVDLLGKHTQYFEPFCGSMAVLLAKQPSQKETVNDLHGDLNNLARIVADPEFAPRLHERLSVTPMAEDILQQAREELSEPLDSFGTDLNEMRLSRAYWYFVASWMGRNGTAGTARVDYAIAVRWTKNGGSPTVRFRNAVDSLPAWHRRLLNVVILNRDAFRILDRFEDVSETAIYCDPPYVLNTRAKGQCKSGGSGRYLHEFEHASGLYGSNDHERLAEILARYRKARIIVSYYDSPRVRELYDGWTFHVHTMNKQLHAQNGRGARKKEAPEVLITNF